MYCINNTIYGSYVDWCAVRVFQRDTCRISLHAMWSCPSSSGGNHIFWQLVIVPKWEKISLRTSSCCITGLSCTQRGCFLAVACWRKEGCQPSQVVMLARCLQHGRAACPLLRFSLVLAWLKSCDVECVVFFKGCYTPNESHHLIMVYGRTVHRKRLFYVSIGCACGSTSNRKADWQ